MSTVAKIRNNNEPSDSLPRDWHMIGDGIPVPDYVGTEDPESDVANAHRAAHLYRDKLLFVVGRGWHYFDNGVGPWRLDTGERVTRATFHGLGGALATEAQTLAPWVAGSKGQEMNHRQWVMDQRFRAARRAESSKAINAIMRETRVYMAVDAGDMDADPYILGCRNGAVDLRTGELREYTPADRVSKTTSCDYDPGAQAPVWEAFLASTFGDHELVGWLKRLMGYATTGLTNVHILPIFWGDGGNGKGTFCTAIQHTLRDYSGTAPDEMLMATRNEHHPTELADLAGKRLVVAMESNDGARLNEGKIKHLTGGDDVTAHRMHQDNFTFRPSHKLVLQTNKKPVIRGQDNGIWRRVRLVPFERTFNPDDGTADLKLDKKLEAEQPGILGWLVAGATEYVREGGLGSEPSAVRAATSEYKDSSDVVGQFVMDCVEHGQGIILSTRIPDMYEAYDAWCQAAGERPMKRLRLRDALRERGFIDDHSPTGTVWLNATLKK